MTTLEETIDNVLIEHLPIGLKQRIDLLLDLGQKKQQIMQTVIRAAGDSRSIIALACEAYVDLGIERRMTETDC